MIFKNITNWKEIEVILREQGFNRQKLLIVHELWYRLQIEQLVTEITPEQLEYVLGVVAEAYDELED